MLNVDFGFAQLNDTIKLKEVDVVSKRIQNSSIGKKFQTIDTINMVLYKNQSLADLLNFQTPVFIKNYGPGSLSTTSFRGGNASQTAVLWNGLNIQNTMLGQIDLSTIPSSFFNQVDVEYGGSSANWGSGAMGGSIHLNNTHQLNNGVYTKLNFLTGNIGSASLSTDIGYSDKRMSFKLKAYTVNNKNNFDYKLSDTGKILKQKNAGYNSISALPELKLYLTPSQNIIVSAWFNKGSRRFPNSKTNENYATQFDRNDRLNVNWNIEKNRIASNIKMAYLVDELNYTDSLANIFSNSRSKNMIFENDNYFKWQNNQTINVAANITANKAITNNYADVKSLTRASLTFGNKGFYLDDKLIVRTSLRFENVSTGQKPITYNLALNYKLNEKIELKMNTGKVYRLPTLNDLYWNPGGNPNLKPEEGFTSDGTICFEQKYKSTTFILDAGIFNKRISNWILWLPGSNGNPTPSNVQEVWSRGTETTWQIHYKKDKWFVQLKCLTSYVISTITKNALENDNSLNKQLIYTPRYIVNGIATLAYQKLILSYQHNYTGYRFTSSDNSTWLNPYHYSTLRLNYLFNVNNMQFGTFANINNVLNKSFQIMLNRPMPLRYYEIGIQINYYNKKQTNKNI